MITEVPYHMMELLSNEKVGIAVWQRYIANTYYVDVLKWNGEKLVLNKNYTLVTILQLKNFTTIKFQKWMPGSIGIHLRMLKSKQIYMKKLEVL